MVSQPWANGTLGNLFATPGASSAPVKAAPAAAPAASTASNVNYTYSPDGTGGVNYFANGQPVTNTVYRANTGQNTDAIESLIKAGYSSNQNTGGGGGGGTSTSSGTTDGVDTNAVLGDINSKLDQYNNVFGGLYGRMDTAAADQANLVTQGANTNTKTLTDTYNSNVPAVDLSYYLSGIGDSSLRLGGLGKLEQGYTNGMNGITTQEQADLAAVGKELATKKAGYQADQANIAELRKRAAEVVGSPYSLLSLADTVTQKLNQLQADNASFDTNAGFTGALNAAAPARDVTSTVDALKTLAEGAANTALKRTISAQIIDNSGASDSTKKDLYSTYVTGAS